VQTVGRCAPWQVASGAAKSVVLQADSKHSIVVLSEDIKEKFISFERPPGFADSPSDKGCFEDEVECGVLIERY